MKQNSESLTTEMFSQRVFNIVQIFWGKENTVKVMEKEL